MKTPKCPRCGLPGGPGPTGLYRCPGCGMHFDDDPDEGGSYYADPTRRIERAEEGRQRRLERLRKRATGRG